MIDGAKTETNWAYLLLKVINLILDGLESKIAVEQVAQNNSVEPAKLISILPDCYL
jgi:hypothetical protein